MPEILGRDNTPLTEANADYVHKDLDSPDKIKNVRCQLTITAGNLTDGTQLNTEFKGATNPEDFVHFIEAIGRVAGRLVFGSQKDKSFNLPETADCYRQYVTAFGTAFTQEIFEALKGGE